MTLLSASRLSEFLASASHSVSNINSEIKRLLGSKLLPRILDIRAKVSYRKPEVQRFPVDHLTGKEQFKHTFFNLLNTTSKMAEAPAPGGVPIYVDGLKKLQPYWYNYTTMAKGRWLGREILEVVSTEFRDRSMEYYVRIIQFVDMSENLKINEEQRYALESGVTTINGKVAKPDTIVRNGDRIEYVSALAEDVGSYIASSHRNVVHRHEPPITADPVKIIVHDKEREFIVINKPGSIVSLSASGVL